MMYILTKVARLHQKPHWPSPAARSVSRPESHTTGVSAVLLPIFFFYYFSLLFSFSFYYYVYYYCCCFYRYIVIIIIMNIILSIAKCVGSRPSWLSWFRPKHWCPAPQNITEGIWTASGGRFVVWDAADSQCLITASRSQFLQVISHWRLVSVWKTRRRGWERDAWNVTLLSRRNSLHFLKPARENNYGWRNALPRYPATTGEAFPLNLHDSQWPWLVLSPLKNTL